GVALCPGSESEFATVDGLFLKKRPQLLLKRRLHQIFVLRARGHLSRNFSRMKSISRSSFRLAAESPSRTGVIRLAACAPQTSQQRETRCHFIRSNVFWRSSRSEALPVFSRVLSIHFFSRAFFVG